MLKKVKNAWGEFFKGTYVVPFKTYAKHPVCLIIWMMICALPSVLYLAKIRHDEKELIKKCATTSTFYRSCSDELSKDGL